MIASTPPRWAEFLLKQLLPARDRETVTGDLHEEYAEFLAPQSGRLRADLWYLRQVSSIAARGIKEAGMMSKMLSFNSSLTLICGCWLAFMEVLLHRPGFSSRAAVDLTIAAIGLITLLVRLFHAGARSERWLWIAAAALIGLGIFSFLSNARAPHFEGFVFVISIVLVLQGLLMLAALGRANHDGRTLSGAQP